jgi:hypothetical protein
MKQWRKGDAVWWIYTTTQTWVRPAVVHGPCTSGWWVRFGSTRELRIAYPEELTKRFESELHEHVYNAMETG